MSDQVTAREVAHELMVGLAQILEPAGIVWVDGLHRHREAIEAALAAAVAGEWRPIETAPKDKKILAWIPWLDGPEPIGCRCPPHPPSDPPRPPRRERRSEMKKQKVFAQKWDGDRSNWLSCIHGQANLVRQEVGGAYNPADWRAGWKEARKNGARVVPVWLSLKP